MSTPQPELARLRIERLGWGGKGIARSEDGRLILLDAPLAIVPGEEVEAELVWQARHAEGIVTRWLSEDPQRVPPGCPYALRCGGCSLWGVPPGLCGELKRQMAADLLRRMLPGAPEWQWLPAPPDALRQRIQLHWDGTALGYHAQRSHDLVPVEQCPISVPELSAAIPLLRDALAGGTLPNEPARWELATGTPPGDVRASAWGKTWRLSPLTECDASIQHWLDMLKMQQHPRAFCQVTPKWAWDSFGSVLKGWGLGGTVLFDLYGGSGFFGRLLNGRFHVTVLVESSPLATTDAAANLANVRSETIRANVETWLTAQPKEWAGPKDTVLLDPPRAGLPTAVSRAIMACGAGTVVLIGCDGAAFCRDVRRICEGGRWGLDKLAVIDLFPNTSQVECVGLLKPA
jgi:23S rRNA (uracil1939-C5)-methyltransferase